MILNDCARKIVTTFKDKGELRLAEFITQEMCKHIEPHWIYEKSILVPIPATGKALQRRGFSHTETLATLISETTGLRKMQLFMPPDSIDQRKLSKHERLQNMASVLQAKPGIEGNLINRPVVIIDDVCTTGATIYAAARTLRGAGFNKIYGLTFGKVLS